MAWTGWGSPKIKDPRNILTKEEFDKLLAAVDREDIALLFELCFISGARIGEVVGNRCRKCKACGHIYHSTQASVGGTDERGKKVWKLEYKPCCPKCKAIEYELFTKGGLKLKDLENEEWWVQSEKKKGDPIENVILTKNIIKKIQEYAGKNGIGTDEIVFPLTRSRVHQLIKAYLIKAGMEDKNVHIHTLRHTAAKYLCEHAKDPKDVKVVQQQLRHSNPSMTMYYVDLISKDRKDLIKRAHPDEVVQS